MNAKARINVPFGASLTSVAELPPGASITADKFGERPSAWPKFALVVVIIGFIYSLLNHYYLIDQMTGGKWGKKPPADEQVDRAGKAGQKDAAEAPDASPAS